MTQVTYKIENDKIIFNQPIKGKNAIKVYFYRLGLDESTQSDLPICTTDGNGTNEYQWVNGVNILTIHIKKKRLFGLLGYKWLIATNGTN